MRPRRPSDPKSLRRVAWLLIAITVSVTGYMAFRELSYALLTRKGLQVDARITRIEARRSGKRVDHTIFYEYKVGENIYKFDDRSDRDRLEELHTATFNAFSRTPPAFVEGGKIALWVDPDAPAEHRANRAKLELPQLIWLRDLFAFAFLGSLSWFALWVSRDDRKASSSGAHGVATRSSIPPGSADDGSRSSVRTSTSHGTLSIEADVDVPFPERAHSPETHALQARMRELQGSSSPSSRPLRATVSAVRASITLNAKIDAVIEEARIELRTRIGGVEAYTLARAQRLGAGDHARLSGHWTAPADITRARIAITLQDGRCWTHELAIA